MDRNLNFGDILNNLQKCHKIRPMQLVSVESGIRKRLKNSIKTHKIIRLTAFDSIRDLQRCDTLEKPDPQSNLEHKKVQVEEWKKEKEKKKKQEAALKKKPFVAGIFHAPLKYEPPPPPRTMHSRTGRVTRPQTSKRNNSIKDSSQPQSFAPKNASFKPELKNLPKLPMLGPQPKEKYTKAFVFNPVLPSTAKVNHKIKSKPQPNNKLESKSKTKLESKNDSRNQPIQANKRPTRGRYVKVPSLSQSQSSSEEMSVSKEPLPKTRTPRESFHASKMSIAKSPIQKSKSSSEERLLSPKSPVNVPMTPEQIAEESKKISPCVTLSCGKDVARKEMKFKMEEGLLQEDAMLESVDHFRRQMDEETGS